MAGVMSLTPKQQSRVEQIEDDISLNVATAYLFSPKIPEQQIFQEFAVQQDLQNLNNVKKS